MSLPPAPVGGYLSHRWTAAEVQWLRANREARQHRWTAAEVERLRVGFEVREPSRSIAEAIGLPISLVVSRARLLGIRRPPRGVQ